MLVKKISTEVTNKRHRKDVFCIVHCTDFETRTLKSGGVERDNYGLFLQDFCDPPGVPRPDPTTAIPAQDAYVLELVVTFDDHGGRHWQL